MEKISYVVKFLQENWIVILLIIGGIITFLIAYADFKVRWAATTPEKNDDVEAKLFRTRVKIFVQFLRDLFKLKKSKSDEPKI